MERHPGCARGDAPRGDVEFVGTDDVVLAAEAGVVFERDPGAEEDPAWVAYLVAAKTDPR